MKISDRLWYSTEEHITLNTTPRIRLLKSTMLNVDGSIHRVYYVQNENGDRIIQFNKLKSNEISIKMEKINKQRNQDYLIQLLNAQE